MDTLHGYAFTNIQWGRCWRSGAQNQMFAPPRQVILALNFQYFLSFDFRGRLEALWCSKTIKNELQIHSKFDFLYYLLFERVLHSILVRFLIAPNLKNIDFT